MTCTKCIERMGPPRLKYPEVRGLVGTLQERIAEVIEDEIRDDDWVRRRIAGTVETWRRDVEERVRLAVDEMLIDLIPDTTRSGVTRNMTDKVLRSMDIGSSVVSEGVEE